MKIKSKGKVHPSPSSSSSDREVVVLSVLSLLPAAILALASVLSLEDREVLAYMLTRSLVTSSSSSSTKKKQHRKPQPSGNNGVSASFRSHGKPPMFECECFDCYTSFWVRWDSSPNRDLIHRVIEAFEDHVIASGEKPTTNRPNKKKPRPHKPSSADVAPPEPAAMTVEVNDQNAVVSEVNDVAAVLEVYKEEACCDVRNDAVLGEEEEDDDVAVRSTAAASGSEHRGLARKVLPDVLGLLNSRLWSLWSPNA